MWWQSVIVLSTPRFQGGDSAASRDGRISGSSSRVDWFVFKTSEFSKEHAWAFPHKTFYSDLNHSKKSA
jgi:hypothetical protein